jgi:hypothetical protein
MQHWLHDAHAPDNLRAGRQPHRADHRETRILALPFQTILREPGVDPGCVAAPIGIKDVVGLEQRARVASTASSGKSGANTRPGVSEIPETRRSTPEMSERSRELWRGLYATMTNSSASSTTRYKDLYQVTSPHAPRSVERLERRQVLALVAQLPIRVVFDNRHAVLDGNLHQAPPPLEGHGPAGWVLEIGYRVNEFDPLARQKQLGRGQPAGQRDHFRLCGGHHNLANIGAAHAFRAPCIQLMPGDGHRSSAALQNWNSARTTQRPAIESPDDTHTRHPNRPNERRRRLAGGGLREAAGASGMGIPGAGELFVT